MSPAARAGAIAVGVLVALAALGLGYRAASRPPQPMAQEDFARISRRIVSLAAEAQLLAESLLQDDVTEHFARAHLDHLGEEVQDQETELDRPAPPALDAQRLRELRERLQHSLTDMKRHLSETREMDRIRAEVARIHDETQSQTPPP